ncbi:hypothetical protein HDC94_002201 [Leifsonia sp. AK011]|uniref:DUF1648 domain-containing protein n=1 Tax=Leifsonia sp. AK011 TaxID=2723075 RepID=UPI0015C82450|nr:DUF1648 domain-containing protein [Leifsonia sp. AK011]NYF11045.1 hypothetical protein [Leifsonia sp. AK011]
MTRAQHIRLLLVGVALPALIGLAGSVVTLSLLPVLPDPVAVHWGTSGEPDGFGSPWILVALPLLSLGYAAFAFAVTRTARTEGISWSQRGVLATGAFLAVVVTAAGAGSAVLQAGLADATAAPSVLPLLSTAIVVGLLATVGAWFALPRHTATAAADPSARPVLDLAPTERAVWTRRVEPGRRVVGLVIGGIALAATAGAIVVWASAPLLSLVIWVGILALVIVAVTSTMFWTIRVDASGVDVRSALGAPRFHYPIEKLAGATVTEINPTRDFGGWGIRAGGGRRTGIVVRAGGAIELRRVDDRSLVVTVDDAEQGAALVNALIARSAGRIQ